MNLIWTDTVKVKPKKRLKFTIQHVKFLKMNHKNITKYHNLYCKHLPPGTLMWHVLKNSFFFVDFKTLAHK